MRTRRGGRRTRDCPRRAAPRLRSRVLHHLERVRPRARHRPAAGRELGRDHRPDQRAGTGDDGHHPVPAVALALRDVMGLTSALGGNVDHSPTSRGRIVRTFVVGFGLVVLLGGAAAPATAQWLVTDARRIGMGGLSLGRSGSLERYNPAYRAVDARADRHGQPKVTIPIPLGIIQFLHDHPHLSSDPAFDPKSTGFNPILVVNTILNLPLYLEVKRAPTPTNDVAFTIGQDSLLVNLGAAAQLVPEDQFGISGSSRPFSPGFGFKGFRVGVMGWLHDAVEFQLDEDRKSTRLNSSHLVISYAVFCLKKKKYKTTSL